MNIFQYSMGVIFSIEVKLKNGLGCYEIFAVFIDKLDGFYRKDVADIWCVLWLMNMF